MKKIFVVLIACALMLAMTGVVSACSSEWDYCKVNGGGQVYDDEIGDITVSFHAKGTCTSGKAADGDVKGEVHIVYHDTKKKLKLPVEGIYCSFHEKDGVYSYRADLWGTDDSSDGTWCLSVVDNGEGSNAEPDIISFTGYLDCSGKYYTGFNSKAEGHSLSGNAQVSGGTFTC